MARTPLNASALNDFDQRVKNAVPGFVQKTWNDSPPSLDTVGTQAEIDAASALWAAGQGRQPVYLPAGDFNITYTASTVQPSGSSVAYAYALLMKSGVELISTGRTRLLATQVPNTTLAAGPITLPQASILVTSTASFPSSGILQFAGTANQVTYTSKDATHFLGCTGGTATLANGTVTTLDPRNTIIATAAGALTTDWAVRNILFDGQTPLAVETEQFGIYTGPARRFEITGCEMTNLLGKAVFLNGDNLGSGQVQRYKIAGNYIHDCSSNAIHPGANGAADFQIVDNIIEDNRLTGGAESIITGGISNYQWGVVSRNTINNWGTLDLGGTDMLCESNGITAKTGALGAGIKVTGGSRIRVAGNGIDVSAGSGTNCVGISLFDSAVASAVIAHNQIKRLAAGGMGIGSQLSAGAHTDLVIIGNSVTNGSGTEADIGINQASEVVISGNTCRTTAGQSIYVKGSASKATVTGNQCYGAPIITDGSNCTVSSNQVETTTNTLCLQMGGGGVASGNYIKCAASDGSTPAVFVANTNPTLVAGNLIEMVSASQRGVSENAGGNNLTVRENTFKGTTPTVVLVGAASTAKRNVGYVTENQGATSVADGGTVTHGLATTPTLVNVTPSIGSQMVSVTAKSSTTFTVAIKTDAGAAGTTQTVYWRAEI